MNGGQGQGHKSGSMDSGEDDNSVISGELLIFTGPGRFAASQSARRTGTPASRLLYITVLNASTHAMFASVTTIRLS